jgi:hypothetical protein
MPTAHALKRIVRSITPSHQLALGLDPSRLMVDAGFTPDPWQRQLLRSTSLRTLMLNARQTGKSTATAAVALHHAMFNKSALVLLLAPTLRQSQELFFKIQHIRACLPYDVPLQCDTSMSMEFPNGSRIISLPGTEETIRGFSAVTLLIIDEAALVPRSLYQSVRPMLVVSNGRLICLSTPRGNAGWFFEEWTGEFHWHRIKVTALECPRISQQTLDEERRSKGAVNYSQEYLCEFVNSTWQVFDRDLVRAAFNPNVKPLFPIGSLR